MGKLVILGQKEVVLGQKSSKICFLTEKIRYNYCGNGKYVVILQCKSRDGAVVARWAHNPKVVSSSLAPATKEDKS